MDEFSLIDLFFKKEARLHRDVIYGIGDDAACVRVPPNHELLISTDTLVSTVHFLPDWDAYDIAYKAVMVNVSDIAAMAGQPCWVSLALTLPEFDELWLKRFSQGLHEALAQFDIALIGGDMTHGPLSITLTIHGLIPSGKAVRRVGSQVHDRIYVSGRLGAAAFAVCKLQQGNSPQNINLDDKQTLMQILQHPHPRIDLARILQRNASAAIDISDGLTADLNHLCTASGRGACLSLDSIPIHPLVKKYQESNAIDFALYGGDDYELCFTIPIEKEEQLLAELHREQIQCYPIGVIEEQTGLREKTKTGEIKTLVLQGYDHFL